MPNPATLHRARLRLLPFSGSLIGFNPCQPPERMPGFLLEMPNFATAGDCLPAMVAAPGSRFLIIVGVDMGPSGSGGVVLHGEG